MESTTSMFHSFQSLSVSPTSTIDFGADFARNKTPEEIVATADEYLRLHSASNAAAVKKFRLFFPSSCDRYAADIENYIAYAVAKGVEELDVHLSVEFDEGKSFKLAATCLFECKTLTHLSLSHCEFFLPPGAAVGFDRLRYLSLEGVVMANDILPQLISNSPLLDNLRLVFSRFEFELTFESLKVSSQSLRKLTMVNPGADPCGIEISAPKLQSFVYYGVHIFGDSCGMSEEPEDSFIDISSLSDAFVSAIESSEPEHDFIKLIYDLRHVKVLTVCSNALWRVKLYEDEKFPILLQNLKELQLLVGVMSSAELDCVYHFFRLCPSPYLENLFIQLSQYPEGYCNPSYVKEEVVEEPLEVTFGHLKVIKLSNFIGSKSEMRLVRFLLEKAVVLESLVLVAPPKSDKESNSVPEAASAAKKDWMDLGVELSLLPKASRCAKIVFCEFLEDDMSVTPTHTEYFNEY